MNLRQAVVFAILMEIHGGILAKSPDYVMEKLGDVALMKEPEGILDSTGLSEFYTWARSWRAGHNWLPSETREGER